MFSKRMVLIAAVIVLVAVNVILLTITGKHTQAPAGFGRGVIAVVSPFQKQLTVFVQSIKNIWNHYFFLVGTAEENDRLKQALGQSLQKINQCSETELANERLRHLLGFEKEIPRRWFRPRSSAGILPPGQRPSLSTRASRMVSNRVPP